MLKGKSTIQLFDAETGAKVLEQSNTNLVTDALDIIANARDKAGLLKWWREKNAHDHAVVSPFLSMMPLYQRALGGILLWDESIAEDPSIMVPPADVSEVGHAGGDYSGDDLYRGSYNVNESGMIDGGYRHVWDFDTDKANGTIKCLSLTSWHGGNIGYHGCFSGDLYPRYCHFYFHSSNTYVSSETNTYGIIIGDEVTGSSFYLRTMEDGTLRLYRKNDKEVWYLKLKNLSKINLFTTAPECTERVVLPFTLASQYASVYVYNGQIHEISTPTVSQLRHRVFTLEGVQLIDKTVDLPFNYVHTDYHGPAVYRDGYYYCFPHSSTELIKVDEQGQEVSRMNFLNTTSDVVFSYAINEFNKEITFGIGIGNGGYSYVTYTLNAKDQLGVLSQGIYPCASHASRSSPPHAHYVKTDDPNSPFVYYSDPTYLSIIPMVNMGYLATINNLKTPILKTAAQTMKITYEIYEE